MAYAPPNKVAKPGLEEPQEQIHKIRITLSSKNVKNLEKGSKKKRVNIRSKLWFNGSFSKVTMQMFRINTEVFRNKGEKVRGMIERKKMIIGSRTEANYAERFINVVRCCWELILTGVAECRWAYQVDVVPFILTITRKKYKIYWNSQESELCDEKTHRLDPKTHRLDPLTHLTPCASLKHQPHLISELYRKFRQKPDIRRVYGEVFEEGKKAIRCDEDMQARVGITNFQRITDMFVLNLKAAVIIRPLVLTMFCGMEFLSYIAAYNVLRDGIYSYLDVPNGVLIMQWFFWVMARI